MNEMKVTRQICNSISQVFYLGAVVTVRITENSPAIKILHEKDLLVCQECSTESV